MFKKKLALFTLCVLFPILNHGENVAPIVIDSEVLRFIDGTPLVNIAHLVHFALQIHVFQHGPKSAAQASMGIKKIMYKNKAYSLEELVLIQKENPKNDYAAALSQALVIFEDIAMPYLANSRGSEEYMIKLIAAWSKQRNKPHTYLIAWSQVTKNEHESLVKHMVDFSHLNEFCDDLKMFLTDFMNTCKKSWKQYQQMRESENKKSKN
ncbi:MAG: hypothetical protein WC707_06265 [Candidatus Babeliaceae bacterium]|jgi:hypothetical protein